MSKAVKKLARARASLEATKIEVDNIGVSQTVLVSSSSPDIAKMDALPTKVMVMLFKKLDSVTRKRIERVCKEWRKTLQDVKQLRTHILIQIPPDLTNRSAFWSYWDIAVRKLVKYDLEVIHFDGGKIPEKTWSRRAPRVVNGFEAVLGLLHLKKADLSKVDITFSNWSLCVPLGGDVPYFFYRAKKVRILRTEITTGYSSEDAAIYFDELYLDVSHDLHKQTSAIFFSESGPMTKDQAAHLLDLRKIVNLDDLDDIDELENRLDEYSHIENHYEFLTNFAMGVHCPKFTTDIMSRLIGYRIRPRR